ncbi:MAG: YlmC/YmxH family sporulation protein [Limnochordia bacterium]|jgi:YlmC/YmxH family sporulation protein|nr:YlmC/YmxH family sporulation protein [Bacillota bacterium]
MLYSELAGKEIISINEGLRLGLVDRADAIIDTETGRLTALILPVPGTRRLERKRWMMLPWHGIKKIGVDLLIVDMSQAREAGKP